MRVRFRGRSKYGAKKTRVDGYTFDSKAEAQRYTALKLAQMAGAITDLNVHPSYELQPAFTYRGKKVKAICYEPDFDYKEAIFDPTIQFKNYRTVAEDVKGVRTEVFRIKEKLFKYCFPQVELRILNVRSRR